MATAPSQSIADELAANSVWLRRLARSLVDDATADDLVQDTMVAALQHPPDTDRPVRPWLRTVLGNAAKMHWRSSSRRKHREERAPSGPEPESPDAGLAKLEVHRQLVEAVIELSDPYREAVILRYVEGLSSAEIARRLDIPAATVRSRLSRALDMLRAELDRKSEGEPTRWQAALIPLLAPPQVAPAAATPIVLGGLAMKVAIVAALAATVVLFVASTRESNPSQATASTSDEPLDTAGEHEPATRPDSAGADRVDPSRAVYPRRFRSSSDRERFAAALSRARKNASGPRDVQVFNFSSAPVPPKPTAPPVAARGKLDHLYIKDRIAEILPLLRECYDLARVADAELAGKLTVDFVIEAEEEIGGYVREATIAEDSPIQHAGLSECVTETVLSLQFVAPEGGGQVRVRIPFSFTRDDG